jgi:hypothetical protein
VSAAASSRPARTPGEQQLGQPLQVAAALAATGGEVVGVAGDAGGRERVDVGEHQLGEAGQRGGRHPGGHRRLAHVPPGHAGADAVGGQQRVHRPPVLGLPTAEGVGALERGVDRPAGVAAARRRRQLEEPAERQQDGVLDRPAHVALERLGVAGHLDDDRGHGALGDGGQLGAHRRGHRRGEGVLLRRHAHLSVTGPLFGRNSIRPDVHVESTGNCALRWESSKA